MDFDVPEDTISVILAYVTAGLIASSVTMFICIAVIWVLTIGFSRQLSGLGKRIQGALLLLSFGLPFLPTMLYVYLNVRSQATEALKTPNQAAMFYVKSQDGFPNFFLPAWFIADARDRGLRRFGSDLAHRTGKAGPDGVPTPQLRQIEATRASGSAIDGTARITLNGYYTPYIGGIRKSYYMNPRLFSVDVHLRRQGTSWYVVKLTCLKSLDVRCASFSVCECHTE